MIRLIFLLLLLLSPITGRASLISADLLTPNDGLLTMDSQSGLEWLDVTATQGQSYDAVTSGYGGFVNLGFRYATISEVSTLYTHAGVVMQQDGFFSENAAGALLLINLMGCTNNCNISVDTQGGLAEDVPFSSTTVRGPFVAISADRSLGFAALSTPAIPKNRGYQDAGSYLVRPIPEPTLSVLLSLGLGVLSLTRRHQNSRTLYR